MQTEIQLEPYRCDIYGLAQSVFLGMLNLDVEESEAQLQSGREMVTAAVYFAGAWKGAVLLQCDRRQACEFTARLMRIPLPAAFDDDVRDAVGELVNIIGGNLKPILPRGIAISMPSVVEGEPTSLRVCGGDPVIRLAFASELGEFWVTVAGIADSQ